MQSPYQEKIWVIEDPDKDLSSQKTKRITRKLPPPVEKNPAVAYSLSLLFWGAGQIYNGQKVKGQRFLFSMLLSCLGAVLILQYGKQLLHALRSYDISSLSIFMTAEVLLFGALVFWIYNANNAYHAAVRSRRTPFTEVPSRVYPFLCSLLIPGWGQHLNGQPVKGSIFSCWLIFSLFSIVSIPAALLAWPSLEASTTRTTIEGIFTLMVLSAPLIPLLWIVGSFDAFKVSSDDLKKERLFDRIKYANNRRRSQGLVRGVIPQIRLTILLLLFLSFLLIISYHYFPKQYYGDLLLDAQIWLQTRGMTAVPALMGKLSSVMR
jgi:TM2 domain-containing membrane protein YozV